MNRSPEDQKVANEVFDKFRDDLLKRELSNSEVKTYLLPSRLGFSTVRFFQKATTTSFTTCDLARFLGSMEKPCNTSRLSLQGEGGSQGFKSDS
ncbi:MAG: hypothetical protein KKF24_08570, partial [Gammaproteobacteria bacterium]|nr:hypothetical protein [Gammaproteobacteria bacterium]MBU1832733.1 hypothetical protein [Gammaproteobacteria bacterium]